MFSSHAYELGVISNRWLWSPWGNHAGVRFSCGSQRCCGLATIIIGNPSPITVIIHAKALICSRCTMVPKKPSTSRQWWLGNDPHFESSRMVTPFPRWSATRMSFIKPRCDGRGTSSVLYLVFRLFLSMVMSEKTNPKQRIRDNIGKSWKQIVILITQPNSVSLRKDLL